MVGAADELPFSLPKNDMIRGKAQGSSESVVIVVRSRRPSIMYTPLPEHVSAIAIAAAIIIILGRAHLGETRWVRSGTVRYGMLVGLLINASRLLVVLPSLLTGAPGIESK